MPLAPHEWDKFESLYRFEHHDASGRHGVTPLGFDGTDYFVLPLTAAGAALKVGLVSSVTLTVDGTLTVNGVVTDSEKVADNAAFADGTTKVQPAGYVFDEVAGTALTENDAAAARVDSKRAQVMVIEDATTRGRRVTVTSDNLLSVYDFQLAASGPINTNIGTLVNVMQGALKSDSFSAAGNGGISAGYFNYYSVLVKATGAVTSWDVRVEISTDGVNWTEVASHTNVVPTGGQMSFSSTPKPALAMRCRCAAIVLGAGTQIDTVLYGRS